MNVVGRLAGFAAVLGLAFGGAALAGAAIGPLEEQSGERHSAEGDAHGQERALSGLAVTDSGYALEADRVFFTPEQTSPFSFRVTDGLGRVVRDAYEIEHEKELHLIVVRRDTAIFEHLHPVKGSDGTWSVDLRLREPGVYRAYADFKIDGTKRVLATELFAPGDFRPLPLPRPAPTAPALDAVGQATGGLDVTMEAPGARAGRESTLGFSVTQGGRPLEALEPYLGAEGHLVALREGDLAYLHVHPVEDGSERPRTGASVKATAPGAEIRFAATFPTPGRYRLFLQFKTGGEIRTASYTVEVPR